MIYKLGDRGDGVRAAVQYPLSRLGYALVQDGIYGLGTKAAVEKFQRANGLTVDGVFGPLSSAMAEALLTAGGHDNDISVRAYQLILDYEVGGGESYYNLRLRYPTVPSDSSGVTIGIGYDLGYEADLAPFVGKVSGDALQRLGRALGKKGDIARAVCRTVQDVSIPWHVAQAVFDEFTLPTEMAKTHKAFPGLWELPLDVQGALVSLVYNRGAAMTGDHRREMRQIRDAVLARDIPAIAGALVGMKRLWPDLAGLRKRRDAEAQLVLGSIA